MLIIIWIFLLFRLGFEYFINIPKTVIISSNSNDKYPNVNLILKLDNCE